MAQQWKHRILATGLTGNSLYLGFLETIIIKGLENQL